MPIWFQYIGVLQPQTSVLGLMHGLHYDWRYGAPAMTRFFGFDMPTRLPVFTAEWFLTHPKIINREVLHPKT